MHSVDLEPAPGVLVGVAEEEVVGGEQVAVGGCGEEIGEEGEYGDGEEG